MVSVCTGPAFTTDDAGNLILAGERRKANPSPCALHDANGLYTDPAGGAFVPDQLSLTQYDGQIFHPSTQISAQSVTAYPTFTANYTNTTCWPLQVVVQCTYTIWTYINNNSMLWWETGSATNSTNLGWVYVASEYFTSLPGWLNYFDWFHTYTQPVAYLRLEPHQTQSVSVGSRITARWGSGTMTDCSYRMWAWGWTVI